MVSSDRRARVCVRHHQDRRSRPYGPAITLKKLIVGNDRAGATNHGKMAKETASVLSDTDVVGVQIAANRLALRHRAGAFIGYELAAIHHHALAPGPVTGYAAVAWRIDPAITQVKSGPRRRQDDPAALTPTQDFHVVDAKTQKAVEPAEICDDDTLIYRNLMLVLNFLPLSLNSICLLGRLPMRLMPTGLYL